MLSPVRRIIGIPGGGVYQRSFSTKAGRLAIFSRAMRVKVNGQDAQLEAGISLEHLVKTYRLRPEQVVIELNRKVPPKAAWANTFLAEGDEVEIVKFLGGG